MPETMLKTPKSYLLVFIFFISFIWFSSLMYNFSFFWEDDFFFISYNKFIENPEDYTFGKQSIKFLITILNPKNILFVHYYSRPLDKFFIDLLPSILGLNALYYRILRAVAGAFFITLCFYLFYQIAKKYDEYLPFLLTSYIIVLPELWVTVLYGQDSLLFTLFFGILALVLFLHCYYPSNETHEGMTSKVHFWALLFLVIFFTHISNIIKHVGRINVFIILFFLLFMNKRKIITKEYSVLIIMLIIISVPLGTIFLKMTSEKGVDLNELSMAGAVDGMDRQGSSFFILILDFFKTFHHTFFYHAVFLLILLLLFVFLFIWRYNKKIEGKDSLFLKELCIFSLLWFIFSVIVLYLAKGLVIQKMQWIRFEFITFAIPQLLFVITFCLFILKTRFQGKKIYVWIIYLFLVLGIFHNLVRLNEWRGGWGGYFLGYDTARQYVEIHADNSLLVMPFDHSSAIYFVNSNNTHILTDVTNSSLLRSYLVNYSSVFIASRYEIIYNDESIVNIANLTVIDDSPYGRLKAFINNYYPSPYIFVYKVKAEIH